MKFRTLLLLFTVVLAALISGFFGTIYLIGTHIKPILDLSPYLTQLAVIYLIFVFSYTGIAYFKIKNVDPEDFISVTERTVTADTGEDVDIVEVDVKDLEGYKALLRYLHKMTVTPNNQSVHSWSNIATLYKFRKSTVNVCFVVSTPEDELPFNDESFTDSEVVLYPEKEYSPLNSTYSTLESIQVYDQDFELLVDENLE